jgi:hypothetical protein
MNVSTENKVDTQYYFGNQYGGFLLTEDHGPAESKRSENSHKTIDEIERMKPSNTKVDYDTDISRA